MADRSVVYVLRAEIGQFKAQMAQAGASVKDAADKMTAANKDGEKFRRGLSGIADIGGKAGLVAGAGLAAATKAAIDWETAWTGVAKTVDGTASEMAALEGQLREMARTMPATHQEIAATAEAAGQLGVATKDVAEFTRIMIELGATTNLTADEAATSIAQFMNVLGTAPDMVDEIGNTLVDLGNKGASTEAQILDMAQRLAGAGKLIGASESEVLALASAMANLGIESQLGGGAMSRTMSRIETAVKSGGDAMAGFAEVANMSAQDFAQLWSESPIEAVDAFIAGLGRIKKSGGDVIGTLADLKIRGTEDRDVLLRLAGSGDMLSKSLDQSSQAWEKNSALFDEFGKKAGTTASEMQVAWNNVKDAGIELGATMLPILSKASDVVIATTDAFQSLPGPIKNASSAALGITAIFGGGLWFTAKTVSGIANMRQSLADLGIQAGGTRTRLLALNGVKFVALAAALAAVEQGMEKAFSTRINAADLERNLEALSNGKVSKDLKRLGDDIEIVTSRTNKAAEPVRELAQGIFTLGQATDTPMDKAAANIEQLDQALASMVENGNIAEARSTFTDLLEVVRQGGGSQVDAIAQFDAFATALDNASAAADKEADAATRVGNAHAAASGQIELSEKELKALQESASKTSSAFIGLGGSLNNSKVSLGDWIAELEKQNKALRDFTKNAQEAARKGLDEGLIQSLQEAGPEGALRLGQLADASEAEIKRANRAWRQGQKATDEYSQAVEDLARGILGLPPSKVVDVRVNGVETGLAALREIVRQAREIPREIRTNYIVNQINRANKIGAGEAGPGAGQKASGGLVTGPGGPTDDLIPTWLSNREYVIKASAVQRYGVGFFDALNAERLATGGQPGGGSGGKAKGATLWLLPDGVASLKGFIKSLEASKKALEDEISTRESLSSALSSAVSSKITSDLFGATDVWSKGGTFEDVMAQLSGDIASGNALSANIAMLQSKGLNGPALDALLAQADSATIANFAALTAAQLDQYEQTYQVRSDLAASVGAQAAAAAGYTAQIVVLQAKVDQVAAEIRTLNGIQKAIEKDGPKKTGHAVGKAGAKGAGKGARNQNRSALR